MPTGVASALTDLLAGAARRFKVPGASLAVLDGDEIEEAAFGIANVATGVEVTTDTVFQIGSITKVYTATLAMQLVDEGRLDLDRPVSDVVSGFTIAPAEHAAAITLRALLTHTSGLEGDVLDDHGRGDDAVARYVGAVSGSALIHAPGELFSYCNSGFVVAGRIIELLRGATWDEVLRDRLFAPLGLDRTATLPEDVIVHRATVGHLAAPETGEPVRAPVWHLPRATGPAGAICSTPREVLAFARMHLDGGIAAGGRVLTEASARAMQQLQVSTPYMGRTAAGCGLAWLLSDWDGARVIGHNGGTFGQTAFLRVIPEQRFAVCLLTNSRNGPMMALEVLGELFRARAGVSLPGPPSAADGLAIDPARFEGRYVRANVVIDVAPDGDGLTATIHTEGLLAINTPADEVHRLRPVDDTTFLMEMSPPLEPVPIAFLFPDGVERARYLHTAGRVSRRVDT